MKKLSRIVTAILAAVMTFTLSTTPIYAKSCTPRGTTIVSATAKTEGFCVKWNKVKGVSKYQIQYSTNNEFKKSKTINVNGASSSSKTISKLPKKKYYVRVRTAKKSNNKYYYSSWSKCKSITPKAKASSTKNTIYGNEVYTTPYGEKYHYIKDCAGKNARGCNLDDAKGYYDPCKKCAQ